MNNQKAKYLWSIDSPADLRKLKIDELPQYCAELREFIIESVAENPGHLGSSLGALELAVAIHYVYNTPNDRLVWDVGHQAYAHKIITGRRDSFALNRKKNGLSGFPKIKESPYDAFGVGHSSTSISAALGMAVAASYEGIQRKVVAVIGDGSMSGGLAFEAMNNVAGSDLLVILNDNNISIDPNVGAIKEYLLKISTSKKYNKVKNIVWKGLRGVPKLQRLLQKVADSTKAFFLHQGNLFEALGFRYFGPIDGNDVISLVKRLENLRNIEGPKLLHTLTVKGKGYAPAERNQTEWHAPGRFNAETGEKSHGVGSLRFQEVFGHTIVELAQVNSKIVGITPAMPSGCSLNLMMAQMPDRAFDVGIAEGHAVTFAAGMAREGLMPFCNIYSSFAQRAVDNVIHDVATQGLEVVLCFDRAGLVGEDGATHHGVFDIALFRSIPNMIISSPADAIELRNLMYTASLGGYNAGFVIRYPRGGAFSGVVLQSPLQKVEIGKGRVLNDGDQRVALLSFGPMTAVAAKVVSELKGEGRNVTHCDLRFAKPLDKDMLMTVARKVDSVVVVEDGVRCGGVGSAVMELFESEGLDVRVVPLGVGDEFVEQATVTEQHLSCGLDSDAIKKVVTDLL